MDCSSITQTPEGKDTIDKLLAKKLSEYETANLSATPETLDRKVWQICQSLTGIEDEVKAAIKQLEEQQVENPYLQQEVKMNEQDSPSSFYIYDYIERSLSSTD